MSCALAGAMICEGSVTPVPETGMTVMIDQWLAEGVTAGVFARTRDINVTLCQWRRRRVASVLAQVGRLTATAVVAGTAAGIATTRLLSSRLYGFTPLDWKDVC